MLHCLALPVLAALLPFAALGSLAENHWHWVFVALAAPVSIFAVYRSRQSQGFVYFLCAVAAGLTLLTSGVIVEGHDLQVGLTLLGAITLACAHLFHLRRFSAPHPN